MVPPGKEVTARSIVKEQKVSLSFQATLTIIDKYDNIVYSPIVINGTWKGVMTLPIEVVISTKDAPLIPQ